MTELLRIGERATNLARLFNVREGFSGADDTLPERLFQPLEERRARRGWPSRARISTRR